MASENTWCASPAIKAIGQKDNNVGQFESRSRVRKPVPNHAPRRAARGYRAQEKSADKTGFHRLCPFEQFIGTPAYMSPEQAMMTSLDIQRHLQSEPMVARPPNKPLS